MTQGASRPFLPRWLVVIATTGLVVWLLLALQTVLTPVFLAAFIAYMFDPVIDRLERWRIPRAIGIVILLTLVVLFTVLLGFLVIPGVVREVVSFAKDLPDQLTRLMARIEPWLLARGITPPHTLKEALSQLDLDAKDLAGKAVAPGRAVLGFVAGGTASALGLIANLLIIPVFAFYLLYDWDRMLAAIRDLIPWRIRPQVVDIAGEVDEMLGQFVRGQLLVMLILCVLYSVTFWLIGVRLAIPIGIVAGVVAFIPYLGGAVALGLALLMCVLQGAGLNQYLLVVAGYTVIQFLEGFVITPRIMEDKLGLGALWVLLALMVFGELFGFMGVLLAVPIAAVLKVFTVRAVAYYRESQLFLAGEPASEVESRISALAGAPRAAPPTPEPPPPTSAPPDSAPLDAALPAVAEPPASEPPSSEPPSDAGRRGA